MLNAWIREDFLSQNIRSNRTLHLIIFSRGAVFNLLALLVFLFLFPVKAALCQASENCLACHGNRAFAKSMFVDANLLKDSAHSKFGCTVCHSGSGFREMPHKKGDKPVQCQNCHKTDKIEDYDKSIHSGFGCKSCHGTHEIRYSKDPKSPTNRLNAANACAKCHMGVSQKFSASAHGLALTRGMKNAPFCTDCHGSHKISLVQSKDSSLSKTKEAKLCLKCHLDDPEVRKQTGSTVRFIADYEKSVHGVALAAGNLKSATCSDCHGAHDLKKAGDPSSHVSKWNIAETCSKCHSETAKTYNASIHGTALKQGKSDAPTCTTCHGEHQIYAARDARSSVAPKNVSAQVCAGCHNSVQISQKYEMPAGQFNTFMDSYHGLASRAGSVEVANCASCHGVHNILPSWDPASTIGSSNLVSTCGRCHPGANKNFAKGSVHIVIGAGSGSKALDWIRIIYIGMIIVVVGGMFLHNFLDFIIKSRHRLLIRKGVVHEIHGSAQYLRMSLNERIQHASMLISFILLTITGFMLRFPDAWWVVPIRNLSQSFFEVRGFVHRAAAVVLIGISLYHLIYLFLAKRGRGFLKDMLPTWKDAADIWKNLLYITGISKNKPLFDRFGYIEKMEYWALVWGVIIMSATGIVMWFENYFIGLFTKLGWDIARTIHFYEAILAALAIVVWHFYFVIFSPNVYPMNTAWLTGKISEEEMAEEHPLELSRYSASQSEPDISK
jgi:cytochrome b subunit of formate dehydrogenase